MGRTALFLAALFWGAPFFGAFGETLLRSAPVADAIKLVEGGVGEQVLLAWVESLDPFERLDTAAILDLKDKKVPEKVIAALVRKGGATKPQPSESETERGDLAKSQRPYTRREAVRYVYETPAVSPAVVYAGVSDYGWPMYSSYYYPSCYFSIGYRSYHPWYPYRYRYGYSPVYRPYYGYWSRHGHGYFHGGWGMHGHHGGGPFRTAGCRR